MKCTKDLKLQPKKLVGRRVAAGNTSGKRCPMVPSKISEHCQNTALLFLTLLWEEKRVVWFVKTSFLAGVGGREGLPSGSKVGEGAAEAFSRGVPSPPALGGWEGKSALLPPAPG